MSERVIVTYNDGIRTREVRGELKNSNIHIVVILNPEERDGEGWKPIPDLEMLELTRRYVVSTGYLRSGTEE